MTNISSPERAYSVTRPPPFGVSVRNDAPSELVVEVRGELDLFTGPILQQHLESNSSSGSNNGHPRKVVYLLPELSFMDARGLHYLQSAAVGSVAGTIAVRDPSPSVRRLLEAVGLGSMIEDGESA